MAAAASIITQAGAYARLPAAVYHGNPTPRPALGATGAWQIDSECPAFYFARAPFNPQRIVEPEKREFDIGSATHLAVLEPDELKRRVAVIEHHDFYSGDAKRAKELYREAGRIPLLTHEWENLLAMRDALHRHPIGSLAFKGGEAERSYFWFDEEYGIWCKARLDYRIAGSDYITDYKSAFTSNPYRFSSAIDRFGYHIKAAWYCDAVEAIEGVRPTRFAFIVQAKDPPFLISIIWLEDESLEWGRLIARRSRYVFRRCLDRGEWPAYREAETPDVDSSFVIGLRPFTKRLLEERSERGDFEALMGDGA